MSASIDIVNASQNQPLRAASRIRLMAGPPAVALLLAASAPVAAQGIGDNPMGGNGRRQLWLRQLWV